MMPADANPRHIVPRFIVLDFDRCLGNTTKLQEAFETVVAAQTGITAAQLQEARERTEASGGSFDTVAYVQMLLAEQGERIGWGELRTRFVEGAGGTQMLEPGAQALLDYLNDEGVPFGIVTYGGELWQRIKLQAAGLDSLPYLITSSKHKGRMIGDWQQADSTFLVPAELGGGGALCASRVTLIDDKAASFEDLPEGADGFWVLPHDGRPQLLSQQGDVPRSVLRAEGLDGVLAALKG